MEKEIIDTLDEITDLIKKDKDFIAYKELEKKLENNKPLLSKISKLKDYDKYDSRYVELKKEILNDKDFSEYKDLEKDLNILIMEINKKLNSLKEKSGCK